MSDLLTFEPVAHDYCTLAAITFRGEVLGHLMLLGGHIPSLFVFDRSDIGHHPEKGFTGWPGAMQAAMELAPGAHGSYSSIKDFLESAGINPSEFCDVPTTTTVHT